MSPIQSEREEETAPVRLLRVDASGSVEDHDVLAIEEPLEIVLGFGPAGARQKLPLSITMRTPGDDLDLVAGFLLTEGLIRSAGDLHELYSCGPIQEPGGYQNVVRAELEPDVDFEAGRLQRHFYTSSSCGVCGKTSLDALDTTAGREALPVTFQASKELIFTLPETLRASQQVFGRTGGLHASALFDGEGTLLSLREDVGRHNALDKLIGNGLRKRELPMGERIVLLSGRASFELLQKAFAAGAPMVCAVGAPSSLAVELADRFGITLIGWLRGERFSIYTHPERVTGAA